MTMKYNLIPWPDSQDRDGKDGCLAVDPASDRLAAAGVETPNLDGAVMEPAGDGTYTRFEWPDSQGRDDEPGALADYEGGVFVPDLETAACAMNGLLESCGRERRYLVREGRLFLRDGDDTGETTYAAMCRDWLETLREYHE